jgi:hypothetical protein
MRAMIIVAVVALLVTCTSTRKEILYELPAEMMPHVKTHYSQQCDKGYVLWNKNCSRCHDQRKDGKKIIPDFKPEQLTGYTLRTQNKRHETNLPDSLVSEEDLAIIMTFLTYKKKNTN